MENPQYSPPIEQDKHDKQSFIDHLNNFIGVINDTKERMINFRKQVSVMNHGGERDGLLFWLNCIEDGSNSLGCTLERYDKSDIVKAIAAISYQLYFKFKS
jgi:hypothetical protein